MRNYFSCATALALSIFAASNFITNTAQGAEQLKISRVISGHYPDEILKDTRQFVPRDQKFPDGRVTLAKGRNILAAWYAEPTNWYQHGALGDKIESGLLKVKLRNGPVTQYRLPEKQVFEDIAPRLADLDGDGSLEIIAIISSLEEGASIGVFGLGKDKLKLEVKASSGFLGKSNQWLNIAGFSNFTGSNIQIAWVEKPHVGGKLVIANYNKGQFLEPVEELEGFSNHVFGSTELRLSGVIDYNGDKRGDLVIPSFDRKTLQIVGLVDNKLGIIAQAELPAPINTAIRIEKAGKNYKFIVGLENNNVYEVLGN